MSNPRPLICRTLAKGSGNLDSLLAQLLPRIEARQQGWVRDLLYGCQRWLISIDWIISHRLKKPLGKKDQDIQWLLRLAVYQLQWGETAAHHVVAESVETTRLLRKARLSGLVNAVLRGLLREDRSPLDAAPEHIQLAHPRWLLELLQASYPDHWRAIVKANNRKGPMCLRVDLSRISRQTMLQQLADAGIATRPGRLTPCSVYLDTAKDTSLLPGFSEGLLSVQDESAQLAGQLLPAVPGGRILDACAAPGGKTVHLLESGWQQLLALELDHERSKRIGENLDRCGREASIRVADAADIGSWWDGEPFDAILLDAPCSGSGVIRRHPDIKQQRRASDVAAFADMQLALLKALWPLLKCGQPLLYATCSVLEAENDAVIDQFLGVHPEAQVDPIEIDGALQGRHGIQLLPDEAAQDGFYYARLIKAAPTEANRGSQEQG